MFFWGTAPSLTPGDDYVIIGQSDAVAGLGDGFAILGQAAQDHVGTALAAVGDLNGDGRADIMLTAPGSGKAYVVFGKSSNTTVSLATLAASGQGFVIRPTVASDLEGMTIAAGGDFNRDGIADYLIGVPKNDTGGIDLGAVYVVWGGSRTTIDLSLAGVRIGGVMIDGAPNLPAFTVGARIGTSVAALPDMNGDGTPDILMSNPVGVSSQVTVLFSPASWQPETNIYGSNDDDVIGVGDGTAHRIGDGNDEVYGFAGNDTITTAGGNDILNGGTGADIIDGGAGIDRVIYSAGAVNIVLADSPTDGFANNDGTGAAAQLQFATLIPAATLSNVDFMVV